MVTLLASSLCITKKISPTFLVETYAFNQIRVL